jgi:hypothetical protein
MGSGDGPRETNKEIEMNVEQTNIILCHCNGCDSPVRLCFAPTLGDRGGWPMAECCCHPEDISEEADEDRDLLARKAAILIGRR